MFLYKVSWIEHVEVNGKLQTHTVYRGIVKSSIAFGAEKMACGTSKNE